MKEQCMIRTATLVLATVLIATTARAGDPQINSLAPYGVERGKEVTITFTGSGLATASEILFYTPGFTVKTLESPKDDTLKATIAVAPECELGIHAVRIPRSAVLATCGRSRWATCLRSPR